MSGIADGSFGRDVAWLPIGAAGIGPLARRVRIPRGALTIGLAPPPPTAIPHRDRPVAIAFGVALFTPVVQALTLPLPIRPLGLARGEAWSGKRGTGSGPVRRSSAGSGGDG